jgi:nitrous oxidase accessory protein NosD
MGKKQRFGVLLATALATLGLAAAAQAATIYVAPPPVMSPVGTNCTLPNWNSIQLAVNAAAPGDTIVVCDGVYQEQVTIGKNLTLYGSGDSVIKAPAALGGDQDLVTVTGGAHVAMSHFVVAGPGSGVCASIQAGIRVRDDATLDLGFTNIRDIRDTDPSNTGGLSGCQNGEAIRIGARGDAGGAGHATIDNVVATGYQKNGITVNGAGSTANIMNTTVRGVGPTAVIAQNGIQVSREASATISTSTIRDNEYTPKSFYSCGLLIFDAAGVNDDTNVYLANEKDKCTFGGRGGTTEGMP